MFNKLAIVLGFILAGYCLYVGYPDDSELLALGVFLLVIAMISLFRLMSGKTAEFKKVRKVWLSLRAIKKIILSKKNIKKVYLGEEGFLRLASLQDEALINAIAHIEQYAPLPAELHSVSVTIPFIVIVYRDDDFNIHVCANGYSQNVLEIAEIAREKGVEFIDGRE